MLDVSAPPAASPAALSQIVDTVRGLASVRALLGALPARGATMGVGNLAGSSGAAVAAALVQELPAGMLVVVAATPPEAERWFADLSALIADPVALYPQREALGEEEHHLEIAGERAETLEAVTTGSVRIVVTTARATAERSGVPAALEAVRLDLRPRLARSLTEVVERLEAMGYERVPAVGDVGQFSVRGGLIDLYGFGMTAPARVEWWGDEVHSVRAFDLTSQRSLKALDRVTVLPLVVPADLARGELRRRSLLELLPADAVLWLDDRDEARADVERVWVEAEHHLEVARRMGEEPPTREAIFLEPSTWGGAIDAYRCIDASGRIDASMDIAFPFLPPESISRDLGRLRRVISDGLPTLILCDNEGQLERLEDLLVTDPRRETPAGVSLVVGALHGGFVIPTVLRVLTDHEIFRRARRIRRPRRYQQATHTAVQEALVPGTHVVHLKHGIGIYRGIEIIQVRDARYEVAVVEYLGGDRLNVPLYRLDQLEPYRAPGDGGERPPPKLHRLGATAWQRQRSKTEAAIREMASELLDFYARRKVAPGFAFPPDTSWQRELESSFLYEDTPDQRTASDAVKRDMERSRSMDRLIVGDAGYGKTEVAVRAAFKAVQAGKQAALLVPTTVLAEQHGRTFEERLAGFPVRVGVLSRFRTRVQQREILSALQSGELDVVIGTHRLLSQDVRFHDLGLLIIDEEHRFGVRHKEKIKKIRLEVDVLTLTATPIPRTLSLSLTGIRDIALIETPPRDRSPVLTYLEPWDDGLIEEAMARELDRGGQVFFVHNRIETIDTVAGRVHRLAPRATVAVGHGRMPERELDEVMRRFVAGDVQVLVSTMIIESGLDVANANTMIVHNAHHFGLAQLYQLRGRVGRGHRRAYCYLLIPENLDADSEERLKVLEHQAGPGAGYRIAMRDLEIRGAGNLLGARQSGHAEAVGIDVYLRWLDEAVKHLQGEECVTASPPPEVVLDRAAYLPDDYVTDDGSKLDLYRRLARVEEINEITELRDELRDRFGPLPEEAERLLVVSELRALGAQVGLESLIIRQHEARLTFRGDARPRLHGLHSALEDVQFAAEVRRAQPLSLKLTRLGGASIDSGLVQALRAAASGS